MQHSLVSYSALCHDYFAADTRQGEIKALEALHSFVMPLDRHGSQHGRDAIGFAELFPTQDTWETRFSRGYDVPRLGSPDPAVIHKPRRHRDVAPMKTASNVIGDSATFKSKSQPWSYQPNREPCQQVIKLLVHHDKLTMQLEQAEKRYNAGRVASLTSLRNGVEMRLAELAGIVSERDFELADNRRYWRGLNDVVQSMPRPTIDKPMPKAKLPRPTELKRKADGNFHRVNAKPNKPRVYSATEITEWAKANGYNVTNK